MLAQVAPRSFAQTQRQLGLRKKAWVYEVHAKQLLVMMMLKTCHLLCKSAHS